MKRNDEERVGTKRNDEERGGTKRNEGGMREE